MRVIEGFINISSSPGKNVRLCAMETTSTPLTGYYHICSDGNRSAALFHNENDFAAAMNRVAVCSLLSPCSILAFALMGNHFHFVCHFTSEDECFHFVNNFKRLTGKYNSDVYGESSSLSRLPVKVIPVPDQDYLRTLIAYVVKNPTKARLDMFYLYPWGTGNLYFRGSHSGNGQNDVAAGSLGVKKLRALCRTRCTIPPWWLIRNGIILPENYVQSEKVEQLYITTRSYMYFLSMNKDDIIEKDFGVWNELRLSDAELRISRAKLSMTMFGTDNIRNLSAPMRLKLARVMRQKYLCSRKQLARIVLLPYEDVARALS